MLKLWTFSAIVDQIVISKSIVNHFPHSLSIECEQLVAFTFKILWCTLYGQLGMTNCRDYKGRWRRYCFIRRRPISTPTQHWECCIKSCLSNSYLGYIYGHHYIRMRYCQYDLDIYCPHFKVHVIMLTMQTAHVFSSKFLVKRIYNSSVMAVSFWRTCHRETQSWDASRNIIYRSEWYADMTCETTGTHRGWNACPYGTLISTVGHRHAIRQTLV